MLRVKYERLRRGWNQTSLAYHASMSVGDISRIERGRLRPYPSQLEKLANVLRIDRQALLQNVSENVVAAGAGDAQDRIESTKPDAEWLEQHPVVTREAGR